MSRRSLLVLAVASAVALLAAGTAVSVSSYSDPAGDSGGAPDITAISVDNDATGTLTITITTNQSTLAADALLVLALDTDANPATGSGGSEYLFGLDSTGYGFVVWNGSDFVDAPNPTVRVYFNLGVARFVVNTSDLGGTSAFNFSVTTAQIQNGSVVARDAAPDTGTWSYALSTSPTTSTATATDTTATTTTTTPGEAATPPPPPPTISLGKPSAKAPGLHTGKRFAITAPVTTDGTGVKVTCTARVGKVVLHPRSSYAGRKAICSGTAPARAAGKWITGTITARIPGDKDTKRFSFPIKR